VIKAKRFQLVHHPRDRSLKGCGTNSSEIMVIRDTFEKDFFAI
jgi:hypothetical protein